MIERNPIRRGAVPMFEEGPGRLVFFEPALPVTKDDALGRLVDDAMAGIERDNPALKGVLPPLPLTRDGLATILMIL